MKPPVSEKISQEVYTALLCALVEERMTGDDFCLVFSALYRYDPSIRPEPVYDALQQVFYACDDHCTDPELREPGDLDDAGLRAVGAGVLERLRIEEPDTAQ